MNKKSFFLSFLIFLSGLAFLVSNRVQAESFSFHLFYNQSSNQLTFAQNTDPVIKDSGKEISIVDFAKNQSRGKYKLDLYDPSNAQIVETEFNPISGAFTLDIPYFSLASYVKIFDNSNNKKVLELSLKEFNTCNGNGICEFEKGETADNCLGDCANGQVTFSEQTKKLLAENNGTLVDPKTGEVLLKTKTNFQMPAPVNETPGVKVTDSPFKNYVWLILTIILALVAIVGALWWYFKLRSSR